MAESPTDGADPSSSGSDEPVLDENQLDQSADEQSDTQGGETQGVDQQSDTEPQDGTTQDEDSSDDEDGLSNFAKAQGFDPENLTEGERKALKLAHDNQKAFRQSRQQESEDTKKALEDVNNVDQEELDELDPYDAKIAEIEANQAKIMATQRVNDFYIRKPDARGLDKEMSAIVLEEAEKNGKAAARYLASDLDRLYTLARARQESDAVEKARKEGRQDERDLLRKRQEASADARSASNSHQSTPKVTDDWIENEYDPSNPEHRQLLDEAMARGDLY